MPRPALGKKEYEVRLLEADFLRVQQIAVAMGYTHGGSGSMSKLLEAIARAEVLLTKQ